LAELIDIFRTECPRLLANLRRSVEIGDARGVQEAAHAIKGTVGNFGAHAASEAARVLEVMGKDEALRELGHLERDLARMRVEAPA
jgi:HPt (histidine-containing phosphotransfer) domain-containing protein